MQQKDQLMAHNKELRRQILDLKYHDHNFLLSFVLGVCYSRVILGTEMPYMHLKGNSQS